MSKKLYLYPGWIRFWHTLNALLFLVLILTGISMQYAGKNGFWLVKFEQAVAYHNIAAVILVVIYGYFVIGNVLSSNKIHYKVKRKGFLNDIKIQFRYYAYGMFRGEKHPFEITDENKFNPLQKISYIIAMYLLMPLLILSGLTLLFPELIVRQIFGISGVLFSDLVHVISGFLLSIFMVVHIYTCTLGSKPGTLFKSMVNGFHEVHE